MSTRLSYGPATSVPFRYCLKHGLVAGLFLIAAICRGDIQVEPTYDEHVPIVATVTITDVPEGAKLRGSFAVSGGSYLAAGENVYHVWAAPGKHTLTAAGVWVLTRDVTVGDQTFPILVDFGQFSYTRTITVAGATPPDPPPPPPPPPGARVAVILEETSQRTPAQAILWDQLRKMYPVGKLEIVDDDRIASQQYVQMCKLTTRPVLLVLTDKGQLVREVACPASVAEVQREVSR